MRGETSRSWRNGAGNSLLRALSTARSSQDIFGSGVGAAQHGDFVSEGQDLDVFGRVGAGEQGQPSQHANEHQVPESEGHNQRSCWACPGTVMLNVDPRKALVRHGDTVLGTHRAASQLRATAPRMTKGQSRGFGPSCVGRIRPVFTRR